MAKLELFYPVKPLIVSQAFGIYNPAYAHLGFSKHNGVDYVVNHGDIAYAMCDGVVVEVGENESAGRFVRYRTWDKVEAEGQSERVMFMYMHAERVLVEQGQILKAGDPLIECDNTGFSTGHHLHVSAFFVDGNNQKIKAGEYESNWCFDFSKYHNYFFAADAQKVFRLYHQVIALLRKRLNT